VAPPASNSSPVARPVRLLRALLSRLDTLFDRVYGWRYNPLYQSGTIAVLLLLVLIVTGIYLLLFYRIGSPYASVERIQDQVWTGRWIRTLHRYASDAAVIAIAAHALRMFLRGRSWGPRALAWVSGVGLLGLFVFIALTGFVMVWDVQGRYLAMEGARLLDALPIFSEPVARAFTGERPMPGAFFFLNYFLHIALPLGMALFLYIHVARVARPRLLPPRGLTWGVVGGLTVLSVLWPAPLPPRADPSVLLQDVPLDWFFAFWVPVSQALSPGLAWFVGGGVVLAVLTVPIWSAPRPAARPAPSTVEERHCTGCVQCTLDCPYDAITMVARTDGRPGLMASVAPEYCVSCGICAGSCAPMSIGPPGRTGRDQLAKVRRFLEERSPEPRDVVLLACSRGAGEIGEMERFQEAIVYPVDCIGSVHTSVAEYLLRGGAGGVLFAACPTRDCWNREGTKGARARLFDGREAELKERVDRSRIRFVEAGAAERGALAGAVDDFREAVHRLAPGAGEPDEPQVAECDRPVHAATDGTVEAGS
jgi:coenzyme F420-reducing hydrogenase delta subunit/Pyruvate/2-oxoacid:ferredoxin oxidoreductase delta subunit